MISRKCGHIVAISSMIAFWPCSRAVLYSTTKCAVKGFMDSLHREIRFENWGVRALTVFPHLTNTRQEFMDYVREKVGYSLFFIFLDFSKFSGFIRVFPGFLIFYQIFSGFYSDIVSFFIVLRDVFNFFYKFLEFSH